MIDKFLINATLMIFNIYRYEVSFVMTNKVPHWGKWLISAPAGRTRLDLTGWIAGLMGAEIKVSQEYERVRSDSSEVERLLFDNRKIGWLMGWEPEVVLEEGLRRTIEWVSSTVLFFLSNLVWIFQAIQFLCYKV